jgi:hypothetical protein
VLEGSLYAHGWRQGSIVRSPLSFSFSIEDDHGEVRDEVAEWGEWVVATQDCDLAFASLESNEPIVELHAVRADDPPQDWGVRSRKLRLDETRYVESERPKKYISPRALNSLEAGREGPLAASRAQALKAWLGLRYDRPAVPTELVPLAKQIAKEVSRKRHRPVGAKAIDVLMQFDTAHDPPRYSLFAIVEHAEDAAEVRQWLTDVSRAVPKELGISDEIDAATPDETSVTLLWTSYGADVSQVTWSGPEPTGALPVGGGPG